MSERFRIRISGDNSRTQARRQVASAPIGHVVEVREETRSDQQNRLLWPCLEDVSNQVIWANRKLSASDWKNGFMMALEHAEFVPGLTPGTVWPLGLSTSILSRSKFSDLIELIYSFGAEHGVQFRTDKDKLTSAESAGAARGETDVKLGVSPSASFQGGE